MKTLLKNDKGWYYNKVATAKIVAILYYFHNKMHVSRVKTAGLHNLLSSVYLIIWLG